MTRTALLGAAWLTLGAIWLGPLRAAATHSFSAHMTIHIAVVALAAPLLALGLAGGAFDPARRWPALFSALPASALELVIVWAWHAPAFHHAARASATTFALEQGTFLASAFLVWMSALGGAPARRHQRAGAGILALLLTSMHMTLLGALLALAPRPLYVHVDLDTSSWWSARTALDDQHLGGTIMLLVGGAVYLAGGLYLSVGLLAERSAARPPTPARRTG